MEHDIVCLNCLGVLKKGGLDVDLYSTVCACFDQYYHSKQHFSIVHTVWEARICNNGVKTATENVTWLVKTCFAVPLHKLSHNRWIKITTVKFRHHHVNWGGLLWVVSTFSVSATESVVVLTPTGNILFSFVQHLFNLNVKYMSKCQH
jgi:hypothetical protein